jgi:hypothetical protein
MTRRARPRLWGGLAAVVALATICGCSQRPFTITDRRVCQTVDGAGKPGPAVTEFAAGDKLASVWFSYAGAKAGQTVKVKFKYTDVSGVTANDEVQRELKPGVGSASVELQTPNQGLAPGKYEAQITNDADVAYGPPLTFEVTTTAGAPHIPSVPGAPAPQ